MTVAGIDMTDPSWRERRLVSALALQIEDGSRLLNTNAYFRANVIQLARMVKLIVQPLADDAITNQQRADDIARMMNEHPLILSDETIEMLRSNGVLPDSRLSPEADSEV